MRPGRLDQLIYIPLPDKPSRVSIFQANLRKSPIAPDITFEQLADVTDGFSSADFTENYRCDAKNAICDSIIAELEGQRRVKTGEYGTGTIPYHTIPYHTIIKKQRVLFVCTVPVLVPI